ncbi:hypothetical protein L1987_37845 [Smallanthus sonchifolius]|uniref:Uncharacterized protein n=1 Tax=Smallanthus sonchifolius TaxID=185202 RepID=A0ACB9HIR2_9ASTR|nr:hypothetical protein L1987_37845 [Smallanthus sonchifolius]
MGDKRLNLNRPLLSVRRFSPNAANAQKDSRRKNESSIPALLPSPSYKSELHSGPLRNPGTVPFVWEQIPGRPKDETKKQKPPIVPNLPPGRILKPKKQDSDIVMQGFYVEKGPVKDSFERSKDSKKEISHSRNDNDNDDGDISGENEKPQLTYGPNFLQFNDDDNEDDSDFDYAVHGNMSYKFCGLLPHFCLRGSIGILNQTPGLSVRTTRLPISSANKTRVGSSSSSSQDARVAAYEPKSLVKHLNVPTILTHESTENTNQKNPRNLEQGHRISDNLSELSPPLVSEKMQVNIQKKGLVSFKELLAYEIEKEANFENPIIEKTLYVDTVHKVETLKPDFKENDVDIFGISPEPFRFDLVADNSKHEKEMITQTGLCNDPKVDQKVKVSQKPGSELSELPDPPPLPKSPSDSWLWRTLPSVNSKTASLWSNHKLSSKTTTKLRKNVESRYPQGLLLPIPET